MLRPVPQVAATVARAVGPLFHLGPRLAIFGGPMHRVDPAFSTRTIHTDLPHGQRMVARAVTSASPGIAMATHPARAALLGLVPAAAPIHTCPASACITRSSELPTDPPGAASAVPTPAAAEPLAAAPAQAEAGLQGATGGEQQASIPEPPFLSWRQLPLAIAIVTAVTLLVTLIPIQVAQCQEKDAATVAVEFDKRRFEPIKARILSHAPPATPEQLLEVAHIRRAKVAEMLQDRSARPMVVFAPEGDGKTTAMLEWARANPYLILADVGRANSYAEGVKVVAEAIGYATSYSPAEQRARELGFKLPELDAMGECDLMKILRLYRKACRELWAEGKLKGWHLPTIVLDHSSRPLTEAGRRARVGELEQPQQEKRSTLEDTLIRVFLDAAKGERGCRFCIVTSDLHEVESAIRSSAPWDEVDYVRLPRFERHEARQLIIHGIHERIKASQSTTSTADVPKPRPSEPTAEEVLAIERDYGATISFLLDAAGCRPRRLLACLAKAAPMTDAELQANRPAMPAALKDLLPARLRDSVVDPDVAASLTRELEHFRRAMTALLDVPADVALPPSISPSPTPGQQLITRVVLVDRLLRQLLGGPRDRVNIEIDFAGHHAVLDCVLAYRLLFLDGSGHTIAYESDAVRDIASNILNSAEHAQRMELVRTLLEWQRASSKAERLAQQPRTIWGFVGDALGFNASHAAVARTRVAELERRIVVLRGQVAGWPPAAQLTDRDSRC